MSLFDIHFNKLKQSGMLPPSFYNNQPQMSDILNPNFYQKNKSSFVNPKQENQHGFQSSSGGLKKNTHNPLLKQGACLSDTKLEQQIPAVKAEIDNMDAEKKEVEELPEKPDLTTMSGRFSSLSSLSGRSVEDKKEDYKREVDRVSAINATIIEENNTVETNHYNIPKFNESYKNNAPRALMVLDKTGSKSFYKSKSDFTKKKNIRLNKDFLKIGEEYTQGEFKFVSIPHEYYKQNK